MASHKLCSPLLCWCVASVILFGGVTSVTLLNGDVTVIGLFDIYQPDGDQCGSAIDVNSVMYAEAVRWYFQQLYTAGDLPVSIGFDVFPVCQSDTVAATEAIKVVSRLLDSMSAARFAGIIGAETSTGAAAVSRVLSSPDSGHRLAQVGFSSTAGNLRNMETYPNFFSVIPDDQLQIETVVQSMLSLEWNRIAVIYENTEISTNAQVALKALAKNVDICIVVELSIDVSNGVNTDDINQARDKILYDTPEHSAISGYVFFGTKTTANVFVMSIRSSGLSSVPIGMFSNEIQLDVDTFYTNAGSRIDKTEGSLAVAPPYHVIEEFQNYWVSLFTDTAKYNNVIAVNPWISEVYYSITDCHSSNCPFAPLNTTEIQDTFRSQPLFLQYAIASAHAYALSIRKVHTDYCGSSTGVCQDFPAVIANDVFDEIHGSTLDFPRDFTFQLQALFEAKWTLTLAANGRPLTLQPSYQLYNFRKTNGDDFTFAKVGSLSGGQLSIDEDEIRDYNDENTENKWPNIRKGQCNVGKVCYECIQSDLSERFVYIPGDIYIVGLVPVYDKEGKMSCTSSMRTINGYQLVEALKHAVEKVNSNAGIFSTLFKDATIGLIAANSCNNPAVAQKLIYGIHTNGLTLHNGLKIDIKGKIIGYVGELGSGVSIAAAQVLSRLGYVQISYASTSPLLSDRVAFPYFLRITTPDDAQAKVMIDVVKRLGGDYIQILYSQGAYGEGGLTSVEKAATSSKVCVIQKIMVEENGNFYSYYEQLRKFPHAKIVLIFIRSHVVGKCMKAITEQMTRGEFVFIGSEAWAKNTDILTNDVNQKIFGSFSVVLELAQNTELRTFVSELQPASVRDNPWSKVYLESKLDCYYAGSYDKSRTSPCENVLDFKSDPDFSLATWATAAYFSAISLLTGAGNHLQIECGDVAELCDNYKENIAGLISRIKEVQIDLHGFGVPLRVFNDNGDGNVGYVLYNIQKDSRDPQKLEYKRVGQYPLQGDPTFSADQIVSPVDGDLNSRCPNDQACSVCFTTETTTDPGVQEKEETRTVQIVLGCLFGVSLLVIIILVVVIARKLRSKSKDNTYNRDSTYARAEDPYLHPTERPMPEYERPPTVGSHQHISPCFSETFDQIGPEDIDFDDKV